VSEAFDLAIDVNRLRSASEWRGVLESLAGSLFRRLQRDIIIAAQPGLHGLL
jgi:hypothetical protein